VLGFVSGSVLTALIAAVVAIPISLLVNRQSVLGPLFYYDAIRLARRGRSSLVRTLYLLGILGAIGLVYYRYFPVSDIASLFLGRMQPIPLGRLAHLNQSIVQSVFVVQTIAVLLFTPGYLAGTIAEEREAGTLPLLFTTHLTDREIILGKLFARLAHIALVLLGTLPVLALLLLWGGVDPALLTAGFAATFLSLFSVGSWSILCSVLSRSVFTAVVASYLGVVLIGACGLGGSSPVSTSPLALISEIYGRLLQSGSSSRMASSWDVAGELLAGYVVLHVLLGVGFTTCATLTLRHPVDVPSPFSTTGQSSPEVFPSQRSGTVWLESVPEWSSRPRVPVDDHPLLWKEMHHGAGALPGPSPRILLRWGKTHWLLVLLWLSAVIPVIVCLGGWPEGRQTLDLATHPLRLAVVILTLGWCVTVGYRSAETVSRERQHGTLSGLLVLPVQAYQLLGAKWLGSILRYRGIGYAVSVVLVLGLLFGVMHPLSFLVVVVSIAVYIAFLASLGTWISVASPDTLRSRLLMTLSLLLLFFGSWLGTDSAALADPQRRVGFHFRDEVELLSFNPLASWWLGTYSWEVMLHTDVLPGTSVTPWKLAARDTAAIMVGSATWAALAGLFWLLAVRGFRRL
jgi:ABC-type transport system involved in multi-copper enzyme maturation permease subunit